MQSEGLGETVRTQISEFRQNYSPIKKQIKKYSDLAELILYSLNQTVVWSCNNKAQILR